MGRCYGIKVKKKPGFFDRGLKLLLLNLGGRITLMS